MQQERKGSADEQLSEEELQVHQSFPAISSPFGGFSLALRTYPWPKPAAPTEPKHGPN